MDIVNVNPHHPRPPVPSNIIKLDGSKYVEGSIEGTASYDCSDGVFGISAQRRMFKTYLTDRFNYVIDGNVILVFDIFTGVERKLLMSKQSDEVTKIFGYICLSFNRGFLIYKTSNESKMVSIVSVDINNGYYELIGNSIDFPSYRVNTYYVNFIENFVMIECGYGATFGNDLSIFWLDSLSSIKRCQTVNIPMSAFLFNSIDGKLIFTSTSHNTQKEVCLRNFQLMNEDGSFTDLENTGVDINSPERIRFGHCRVCLDPYIIPDRCKIRNNIDGQWYGNKIFVFHNQFHLKFSERIIQKRKAHKIVVTTLKVLMFELETRMWSEIRLNLPLNRAYYQFHLDNNGILNVVTYAKTDDESEKLRMTSLRIALLNPDTLINLCWVQAREVGLADKFVHLREFI